MDAVAHLLKNDVLRTDLASEQSVIKKLRKHAQSQAKLWRTAGCFPPFPVLM